MECRSGRRAFEQLYMQGDLMICERNGMEKSLRFELNAAYLKILI